MNRCEHTWGKHSTAPAELTWRTVFSVEDGTYFHSAQYSSRAPVNVKHLPDIYWGVLGSGEVQVRYQIVKLN